ncbi:hypothetical protein VNI00_004486 [Paramarasmius palmivorus]|uniref:Uncharacterized protein n=1 Tax=Paramarasmius palmivorus TaxID=297713 RepID=A0AAW0DLN4_9AGAR
MVTHNRYAQADAAAQNLGPPHPIVSPRRTTSNIAHANRISAANSAAQQPSRTKRIRVHLPNIDQYTQIHRRKTGFEGRLSRAERRSPIFKEREAPDAYRRHLLRAMLHIQRFSVPMTWDRLKQEANPRETKQLRELIIKENMEGDSYPIQAQSAIWEIEGRPAMVYLSSRQDTKVCVETLPLERQHDKHRLLSSVIEAKNKGIRFYHDGFKNSLIERYYESVQTLCTFNGPKPDHTSRRHGVQAAAGTEYHHFRISTNVPWTSDPKAVKPGLVYSNDGGKTAIEPAGVLHLVEGWEQRGHHNQGLYLSSALSGSGQAIGATANFYETNNCLERCVEAAMEVFFPEQHHITSKARDAARVVSQRPGGCYIGRAVVYKLQLFLHCDNGDYQVSASFPAGRFNGGFMIIPQFKAKLNQ